MWRDAASLLQLPDPVEGHNPPISPCELLKIALAT